MRLVKAICAAATFVVLCTAQAGALGIDSIPTAMERAAEQQEMALCSYSVHRVYRLENKHLDPSARMEVDVQYTKGKPKQFRITSMQANGVARRSLLDLLKAESQADGSQNAKSATAAGNYDFTLLGEEACGGIDCYKLAMKPKRASKYLVDGTAWVSKQDLMFVRIQGVLSKSPSFWLAKPEVEQRFSKIDGFWVPTFNKSITRVLFLGEADLTIEYSSYSVQKCRTHGLP